MKKHQLKNSFTYFMKGTEKALKIAVCILGATMVSAVISIDAKANQTDLDNNVLSKQEEQTKAKAQWREKNGDWQPNLTAGVEQEALAYVLKKQKELDDEKAKSKAKN